MPPGSRNAAKTFQRFIDQAFRGLPCVYPYIDDILVASANLDEHHTYSRHCFNAL